jgi:PTS system nitrogen regulatory IIA component
MDGHRHRVALRRGFRMRQSGKSACPAERNNAALLDGSRPEGMDLPLPSVRKTRKILNVRGRTRPSTLPCRPDALLPVAGFHSMKILDVLPKEAIIADLKARDKHGVLKELVAPIASLTDLESDRILRVLMERERLGSTGIGNGIGIPHGKLKELENLILGFGLSRRGVDFESMDGRPTHIFFTLVTPENSTGLHLKLLARISKILKHDPFRERLLRAADRDEIYTVIQEEDEDF